MMIVYEKQRLFFQNHSLNTTVLIHLLYDVPYEISHLSMYFPFFCLKKKVSIDLELFQQHHKFPMLCSFLFQHLVWFYNQGFQLG